MNPKQRGTRRAGRLALLWCALLFSAAETGGAFAPPCAQAAPLLLTSQVGTKPVGDPDTPDEGGHKTSVTSTVGATSPAGSTATGSNADLFNGHGPFAWLAQWIRSIVGHFHQG
jgi:hypothetical protein